MGLAVQAIGGDRLSRVEVIGGKYSIFNHMVLGFQVLIDYTDADPEWVTLKDLFESGQEGANLVYDIWCKAVCGHRFHVIDEKKFMSHLDDLLSIENCIRMGYPKEEAKI